MILLLVFISLTLGLALKWHLAFVLIIALSLFLFLLLRFKKRIVVIAIISFLTGIGISYISFDFNKETYKGVVIESKENYFIISSSFEKLYVSSKNNTYEVGDIVSITSKKKEISFTRIESQFDFETYLKKKGVKYELSDKKIETHFSNPIRLKKIKEKALGNLDKDTRVVVNAIIFNDIDDGEITSSIKELHLLRLLSTSGIYIALFYKLINGFFALFIKEKYSKLISLFFIVIYTILLFPKFSLIRFTTFLIFRYINEFILKKKISYLSLYSLVGLFFIIIDYHLTYSISFLLGFIFPLLSFFIHSATRQFSKKKKMLITYLLFFIFIIPLDIYFYNEFSPLSYVFQIVLLPLFYLIALSSIFMILGIPLYPVTYHLVKGMKNITSLISLINIKIYAPIMNEVLLAIYIVLLIVLVYFIQIKFKPILKVFSFLYPLLLVIYFLPINNLISSEVTFINVGQGDSCLIRKGNTAILIDTGGLTYKDVATECLIPFFKKKQIYNIDLLITTHDDFDHNGAASSLINNLKVKNYITDSSYFPISVNGINIINYNNHTKDGGEDNEKSLVIGFNLSNTNYLVTGDASKEIEYKIMNEYTSVPCDVLKVGHHGSNTSTSEEWIKYLHPKEAIISCGKNNKYGHPHKEVISILKNNNVKIKRTDELSSISYFAYCI